MNGGENTVGCGVFFAKDLCCVEAVNEDRLPTGSARVREEMEELQAGWFAKVCCIGVDV